MISKTFSIEEAVKSIQTRVKMFPNLTEILSKFDDDSIVYLAQEAIKQASLDGFNDDNIVLGASFLVAHYCSLSADTNGNIQEQTAAVLTQKFFDRNGSDNYLVEYTRMKKSLSRNFIKFL